VDNSDTINIEDVPDILVVGDSNSPVMFANLLYYAIANDREGRPVVELVVGPSSVKVDVLVRGPPVGRQVLESLFGELIPEKTTLSLDLFIVKILARQVGAVFSYRWDQDPPANVFTLELKRTSSSALDAQLPSLA